jgi:hypothetical protein
VSEPAHNYLAWRIGELEQHVALVARVKELEQQRDAAVAILQNIQGYHVSPEVAAETVDEALAALGAEEAK